jgi:hypothetical protein
MKAPRLELADIVRQYGSAYLARYGKATFSQQSRGLKDIALCRTAALGGHVRQCDQCGHRDICHHSCRNPARRRDTMTLHAMEFLRRFLLHVFPRGFMHIRYYGFLSNRNRKQKIALCRRLLGLSEKSDLALPETSEESIEESQENASAMLCPVCKKGRMIHVDTVRPDLRETLKLLCFLVHDTR